MSEDDSAYLEHYGVLGMKWGVRRSREQLARARKTRRERRDPSTPEGAERARRKSAASNRRTISDSELDDLVNRLQKEKKLRELVSDDLSPGAKASKAILSDTGRQVAKQVLAGATVAAVSVAVGNKMGDTSKEKAKNTATDIAKLIKTGGKQKK